MSMRLLNDKARDALIKVVSGIVGSHKIDGHSAEAQMELYARIVDDLFEAFLTPQETDLYPNLQAVLRDERNRIIRLLTTHVGAVA